MNTLFTYLNKPVLKHILFWILVYSFYVSVDRVHYQATSKLLFTKFYYLVFQIFIAYATIYLIIPHYKKHKNILISILSVISLLILLNCIYVVWHIFLNYSVGDNLSCWYRFQEENGELSFWKKVWAWKKDGFWVSWISIQPSLFLIPFLWYEKNLKISVANEQKKIAELEALKNQLNPHFLFNTLNNLYALAIEKSEKTPIVIEHLSEILDYILYRCKDKYVPLKKEIELIENYLALEKIRYSKRVEVTFNTNIQTNANIAPLILLTFIENAFKHGVRQELNHATIKIDLATNKNEIQFSIENTKPTTQIKSNTDALGLKNVKNQLDLLYTNSYELDIKDSAEKYLVTLVIKDLNV